MDFLVRFIQIAQINYAHKLRYTMGFIVTLLIEFICGKVFQFMKFPILTDIESWCPIAPNLYEYWILIFNVCSVRMEIFGKKMFAIQRNIAKYSSVVFYQITKFGLLHIQHKNSNDLADLLKLQCLNSKATTKIHNVLMEMGWIELYSNWNRFWIMEIFVVHHQIIFFCSLYIYFSGIFGNITFYKLDRYLFFIGLYLHID